MRKPLGIVRVALLVASFLSSQVAAELVQLDQQDDAITKAFYLINETNTTVNSTANGDFDQNGTLTSYFLGKVSDWWKFVDYRGTKVSVIDMHLHTGTWDDLPQSFQDDLLEQIPFPFNFPILAEPFVNILLSAYGIAAQLVCSRIQKGVLFAVYAPETTGLAENEFVQDQINSLPNKFYGLASLPVNDWEKNEADALDLLRQFLVLPEFIGVKMAHPHMKINFNDATFYSIYGVAAEIGKPVYIHTGLAFTEGSLTNKEASHPDFTEEFIQLYPDVTFIVGHYGNKAIFDGLADPFDASFRLATTYSNVYLEASALGSEPNDPDGSLLTGVYQKAKELGLIERMLYGSDGPQFPGYVQSYLERTLDAMERADYTVEEAELVLDKNFKYLFNVW